MDSSWRRQGQDAVEVAGLLLLRDTVAAHDTSTRRDCIETDDFAEVVTQPNWHSTDKVERVDNDFHFASSRISMNMRRADPILRMFRALSKYNCYMNA